MRALFLLLFTFCIVLPAASLAEAENIFDFKVSRIDGEETDLSEYKGKILLIANTASRCGYTYQLGELEKLRQKFGPDSFEVLGFPSNDFGGQEPGSDEDIAAFCSGTYNVSFPLFSKGAVKGERKQPLFQFLTTSGSEDTRGEIKWNFEKFIVGKDGKVIGRFPSAVEPLSSKVVALVSSHIGAK